MSDKFWVVSNGSESYLSHHGIKGQKWGVRNGPPYPLKPKKYKSLDSISHSEGRKPGGPFTRTPNDFIIKKGAKYSRYTTEPNETFKERMYVVGGTGGSSSYMDVVMTEDYNFNQNKTLYCIDYELTKDIMYAGIKETNAALSKAFGKDVDFAFIDEVGEKNEWDFESGKISKEEYIEREKKNPNSEKRQFMYDIIDFMYDNKYKKEREKFIDILIKDGYDAILDPADSFFGYYGIGMEPTASIIISNCLKKINIESYT